MQIAIFGIDNGGLNLAANLFVFGLVVIWLALIVWTYLDAQRRIEDPVLVACATAASLFPYIGTFVYSILRPPEFLDDARERDLEIRAAELRVRQLAELSCPNCRYPVEKNFLRCPRCQRRLKDPCESCGKPVDPRWAICPYCETQLPGARQRQPQRQPQRKAPRPPQRQPAQARRPEVAPRPAERPASPRTSR
jgi:Double zinc ribbon